MELFDLANEHRTITVLCLFVLTIALISVLDWIVGPFNQGAK